MYTTDPKVILVRHGIDALDDAWLLTKIIPGLLGVPGRGPEKNIPAIIAGLRDYEHLALGFYNDSMLASDLCYGGLIIFSSRKKRAVDSINTLRKCMWACFRGSLPGLQRPVRFVAALDGRNYGFTWHRTEAGLKILLPEDQYAQLLEDPFNYRPCGGENWPDVIARLAYFIQERVINTRRNMLLMTHHELIPIIEDLLQGKKPDAATIKRADTDELDNATARVWHRRFGEWQLCKEISGRQERDYSLEEDAIAWRLPPLDREVVYFDQVRFGQRMRA